MFFYWIVVFTVGFIRPRSCLYCSICGAAGQPICGESSPFPTICPDGTNYCLNSSVSYKGLLFNIIRSCSPAQPLTYKFGDCSYTGTAPSPISIQCSCYSDACNINLSKANLSPDYYQALAGTLCSYAPPVNTSAASTADSTSVPTAEQLQQIRDLSAGIVLPGKETVWKILGKNYTNSQAVVSSALQNFSAGWMSAAFNTLQTVTNLLKNGSQPADILNGQLANLQQLINASSSAFPGQLQNWTTGDFSGNSFVSTLSCFTATLRLFATYPYQQQNSTSLASVSTRMSAWLSGFSQYFPPPDTSNLTSKSFPPPSGSAILTPNVSSQKNSSVVIRNKFPAALIIFIMIFCWQTVFAGHL